MSLAGERAPGPTLLSCRPQCPRAAGSTRNEPCVVSCATSRVIIYPPPVVVTFPGPIVSTCPQEAVVGSSEALCGAGPAPLTPLRAEIPQPEPGPKRRSPVPKKRGPRRCSYIFASHWIHPCSRAGSRCSQEAESGGHLAEKEGPETKNGDAGKEDKEALEEPHGETTPEGLMGSCCPSGADLPLSP